MKYWASNITVIPLERDSCLAPAAMAQDSDWLSFGLSSGTRCGERPRGLFLQLLLGSMLLVAGSAPVQASGVVYKCMRAFVYVSGPPVGVSGAQAPGFAPASGMYGVIPAKSNIKHQTTTVNTGIHSPAPCHNPRSESPQSINHSFIHSFTHSNGALLAHQTTSLSVPLPAARNGAAASAPLPEAGGRGNKMNHHFQICTKGYLARPGIPVPASGLWIQPSGGNRRVKVERWKSVKEGRPLPFTHLHTYTFTPISPYIHTHLIFNQQPRTHNRQQHKAPPSGYPEKTRGEPSLFHSLHPSKCIDL